MESRDKKLEERIEKFEKFFGNCNHFVFGNEDIYGTAGIRLDAGGTQGTTVINGQIAAAIAYFSESPLLNALGKSINYSDLCSLQILKEGSILDLGAGGRSYFARTIVPIGAKVTSIDLGEYEDYGPVRIPNGKGGYQKDSEIMVRNHKRIVGNLEDESTLKQLDNESFDMITSAAFFIDVGYFRDKYQKPPFVATKKWWDVLHTKLKKGGISFHDTWFSGAKEVDNSIIYHYYIKK
jgi:hypothetical protein